MLPVKFTASVVALLHLVWSAGLNTIGAGLTVMVNDSGVPVQPLIVGVTVIVPLIAAFVVLVVLKAAIFPFPVAGNPIAGLVFTQL
jgi:ABC-type Na+ efflux pump permease subunit